MILVGVDAFVAWELAREGTGYRNDEHRCDPASLTHDCSGFDVASLRANGRPDYPCVDTYQMTATLRASGRGVSIATARATYGYVILRGGAQRGGPQDAHGGHVVTSLGDGRTIEAYDTADGVIIGHVDGRIWHDAGPMDAVDYSHAGPPPGPQSPGEAKYMGMAAKIVPGAHVQTKAPWENRYPFVGFLQHADLRTDAIGFNGAQITNPPNHLNPHGATTAYGMSIFHLGVLAKPVDDVDEIAGALVGLAGDGGSFTIHAAAHYL